MKNIGVEFKKNGKEYVFFNNNIEVKIKDYVIVETERGLQFGYVSSILGASKENDNHSCIVKVATKEDIKQNEKNIEEAGEALLKAQNIANNLNLDMKFLDSYYTFDRKQLVFQFLADNRVDFRELAKSLASIYKTRIELRQVGVRDKAKEVSGIGQCGRKLCCSCFLNDLDSVGIAQVKNQNLSLNPNKINGLCGRLLCCLKYEDELYSKNKKGMPEVGKSIEIDGINATILSIDIPQRKYTAITESGEKIEKKLDEVCDKCEKNIRRKSNK